MAMLVLQAGAAAEVSEPRNKRQAAGCLCGQHGTTFNFAGIDMCLVIDACLL